MVFVYWQDDKTDAFGKDYLLLEELSLWIANFKYKI